MSIHVGNQEKANKLSELIGYYELCNRAEGKSPKSVPFMLTIYRRVPQAGGNQAHYSIPLSSSDQWQDRKIPPQHKGRD